MSLSSVHLVFLREGVSLNLALTNLTRLASWHAPRDTPVPTSPELGLQTQITKLNPLTWVLGIQLTSSWCKAST